MGAPLGGVQAHGAPEPRGNAQLSGPSNPQIVQFPLRRNAQEGEPPSGLATAVVFVAIPIRHAEGRWWHVKSCGNAGRTSSRGRFRSEAEAIAAIRKRFGRHSRIVRYHDLGRVLA